MRCRGYFFYIHTRFNKKNTHSIAVKLKLNIGLIKNEVQRLLLFLIACIRHPSYGEREREEKNGLQPCIHQEPACYRTVTVIKHFLNCIILLQMRQTIINVYITGYSISLIALVASLVILCTFR